MSIFGDATIQASLVEKAEHRQIYRLVGLHHELIHWPTPHKLCPAAPDDYERDYDPAEVHENERWIIPVRHGPMSIVSISVHHLPFPLLFAKIFEPARKAFFVQRSPADPPTMQFMLPMRPLPMDAEVAVLIGLHQVSFDQFKRCLILIVVIFGILSFLVELSSLCTSFVGSSAYMCTSVCPLVVNIGTAYI